MIFSALVTIHWRVLPQEPDIQKMIDQRRSHSWCNFHPVLWIRIPVGSSRSGSGDFTLILRKLLTEQFINMNLLIPISTFFRVVRQSHKTGTGTFHTDNRNYLTSLIRAMVRAFTRAVSSSYERIFVGHRLFLKRVVLLIISWSTLLMQEL